MDDQNTVVLHFTPESMKQLQELAKELNTTVSGVIGKALALLKISKNKRMTLRSETSTETLEIKSYQR